MRKIRIAMLIAIFGAVIPGFAKDPEPQFKSVERQGACKGSGAANCQRHQEGAEREWRRGLSKAEARSAKGFEMRKNTCRWKRVAALAAAGLLLQPVLLAEVAASALPGPTKQKIRGYMTARIDASTVAIMDDQIHAGAARIVSRDSSGERPISGGDLATGMMMEAEGVWTSHHQFSAEKITVDAGLLEKQIHETAYLQEEPRDAGKIGKGEPAELKADGEWLLLDASTKRAWTAPEPTAVDTSPGSTPQIKIGRA